MSAEKKSSLNLRNLRNRPLCIICGRPGEAEEIAKALGISGNKIQGDEIDKVADGHTFYLGSFDIKEGKLDYYLTSSLQQGIQSFAVNAAVLFSLLLPRFAIHAGVCAGYDDPSGKLKMALTDVVLGEAAINYEEGKWETIPGQKGVLFRPAYNRVVASAGDLQAFADSPHRPRYHYGEYISGSAVRTDAGAVFDQIRSGMGRNAIALDMEASAFIQLCGHFGGKYAICLGVVKGISDFGNSQKGRDENTPIEALKNTASALQDWIKYRIPFINWEVDERDEPGAQLVPGYYGNFVKRVLDNYYDGLKITLKNDESVIIPSKDIKGFKSILPKGRNPAANVEMGNIAGMITKYDICEIKIGLTQNSRSLFYKAGYLMDWCRTCNALAKCPDGVYQVEVFERELRKTSYYSTLGVGSAGAIICTWEDTEEWLKEETSKASAAKEKAAQEEAAREEAAREEAAREEAAREEAAKERANEIMGAQDETTNIHQAAGLPHGLHNGNPEMTPPGTAERPGSSRGSPGPTKSEGTNGLTDHDPVAKQNTGFSRVKTKLSFPRVLKRFTKHSPKKVGHDADG